MFSSLIHNELIQSIYFKSKDFCCNFVEQKIKVCTKTTKSHRSKPRDENVFKDEKSEGIEQNQTQKNDLTWFDFGTIFQIYDLILI